MNQKKSTTVFLTTSILSLALFPMATNATVAQYVPNRILVKNVNSSVFDQTQGIQNHLGVGVVQIVKSINHEFDVIRYSTQLDPKEVSLQLMDTGFAEWAQPDYLFTAPFIREDETLSLTNLKKIFLGFDLNTDPAPLDPPALPNPGKADPMMKEIWGISKIQADRVWNFQQGSGAIIVADIDTGVDYNHPDLVNNIWRNPNPTKNDLVGYDFINEDPLPFDDLDHGTHTAGTIGATGNNGVGIAGVSQRVSIMVLKFLGGPQGQGTTSDAVQCIDYAIQNGARVINASWGGYVGEHDIENKIIVDAIERAEKADVLFVAAAGNDGRDIGIHNMMPGGIENPTVLTVASTTSRDTRSFFSNFSSSKVHVAAPGSDIYSTVPGKNYKRFSGTSMAAPHVSGLAALILSERPDLNAQEVKEIIKSTVDPLETLKGKIVTGGRVNARAAVERAQKFGL